MQAEELGGSVGQLLLAGGEAGEVLEASALRSVVLLAASFPGKSENHLRALVANYIAEAKAQEWPLMARRAITLTIVPHALFEALQFTLSL